MSRKSRFGLQTTAAGEPHYPFPLWIGTGASLLAAFLLIVMALSGYGRSLPDFLIWILRMACIIVPIILWGMVFWDRKVDKRMDPMSVTVAIIVTIIGVIAFIISTPFHVM